MRPSINSAWQRRKEYSLILKTKKRSNAALPPIAPATCNEPSTVRKNVSVKALPSGTKIESGKQLEGTCSSNDVQQFKSVQSNDTKGARKRVRTGSFTLSPKSDNLARPEATPMKASKRLRRDTTKSDLTAVKIRFQSGKINGASSKPTINTQVANVPLRRETLVKKPLSRPLKDVHTIPKKRQAFYMVPSRIDTGLKRNKTKVKTLVTPLVQATKNLVKNEDEKTKKRKASREAAGPRYIPQFDQLDDDVFFPDNNLKTAASTGVKRMNRSVRFQVPNSEIKKVTPRTIRKTPLKEPSLRRRLELWLNDHGQSVASQRHLHCFGLHLSDICKTGQREVDLGASPNLTLPIPGTSRKPSKVINDLEYIDLKKILLDLKELLLSGNAPSDADEWLQWIVAVYPHAKDQVLFWELSSMVHELAGDKEKALEVFAQAADLSLPSEEFQAALASCLAKNRSEESNEMEEEKENQYQTPLKENKGRKSKKTPLKDTPDKLNRSNMFESTLLKYAMAKESSSISKAFKVYDKDAPSIQATLTPVRRSARLLKNNVCRGTPG